ncbi:3-oxoacyl-ACP synthase [Sphingobium sp. AS12]|uniref:3-oxoacyl-ACP synthase n=1 Tax=Sphingobium sp. AS12 TaxID=2849495 RepID=UPI001C31BBAE|nr:3-oxoacyl-ACP synthase [Sphingobium sp. AS12]MBV2150086.1 3-oxoacyl-ACP synthase [Sphingobium sp. AS12]
MAEPHLSSGAAEALARLLPVLGCGEEAASLAFESLAKIGHLASDGRRALRQVAIEERVHDGLIHSLAANLPAPPEDRELRSIARRFHLDLGRSDPTALLARIAALDSAVCLVLSRLLRPGTPLSGDPAVTAVLRRIAEDEARHVRVTRRLAMARADERELQRIAAPVRERLGALLTLAGDAFETLAFDPRWLRDDIARFPAGLFRQ